MHGHHADSFLFPLISRSINGHGIEQLDQYKEPNAVLQVAQSTTVQPHFYFGFDHPDVPENSIAIIPITGVITKYYVWWMNSTSSMMINQWVKQAEANPKIKKILFVIDSPGGMVYGTRTAVKTIFNCTKPTMAFVNDGYAASCGYWYASACDTIWCSQPTDLLGSIGTKVTFIDYSGYYEAMKIKVHDINADQSPDKNKNSKEALKGNYKLIRQEELNPLAAQLIEDVKLHRGDKINLEAGDPFTGNIYMYKKAKSIGLVDGIGTIEEALSFLETTEDKSIVNYNSEKMSLKKWLSGEKSGKEGDDVTVTAAELEELRGDLTASQTELEASVLEVKNLKADKTRLEGELKTSTESLASMTTERDQWKEKAEKYGKSAGDSNNPPKKEGGEGGETDSDAVSEDEHFASFAHNQEMLKDIEKFS